MAEVINLETTRKLSKSQKIEDDPQFLMVAINNELKKLPQSLERAMASLVELKETTNEKEEAIFAMVEQVYNETTTQLTYMVSCVINEIEELNQTIDSLQPKPCGAGWQQSSTD